MEVYVQKDLAAIPKDGEVITDSWWAEHPANGLVFHYKKWYPPDNINPQCNKSEYVARKVIGKCYPNYLVTYMPCVYVEHGIGAMRQDRRDQRSDNSG